MLRTTQSHLAFLVAFVIVMCVVMGLTSCIKPNPSVQSGAQSVTQTETPVALAKESSFLLVPKPKLTDLIPNITSTEMLTDTFVLLPVAIVPQDLAKALGLTGEVTTTLAMIPSVKFTEIVMIPDKALLVVPTDKLKPEQSKTLTVGSMTLAQSIVLPQSNRLLFQLDKNSLQALSQPASESEQQEFIFNLVDSNQQITLSFSSDATDPTDPPPVCGCPVWSWCLC